MIWAGIHQEFTQAKLGRTLAFTYDLVLLLGTYLLYVRPYVFLSVTMFIPGKLFDAFQLHSSYIFICTSHIDFDFVSFNLWLCFNEALGWDFWDTDFSFSCVFLDLECAGLLGCSGVSLPVFHYSSSAPDSIKAYHVLFRRRLHWIEFAFAKPKSKSKPSVGDSTKCQDTVEHR